MHIAFAHRPSRAPSVISSQHLGRRVAQRDGAAGLVWSTPKSHERRTKVIRTPDVRVAGLCVDTCGRPRHAGAAECRRSDPMLSRPTHLR
jgi:hypothetical protein